MTSRSQKYVIISLKKVRKRDVREISANYLCKKKPPSWKSEKLAHFEFLNSNISVFGHDFKPKIEISTDFSVIWRWYKRLVIVFSGFWIKIGGWCGSSAQDPHHDPQFFLEIGWSCSLLASDTNKYHHALCTTRIFKGNSAPFHQKVSLKSWTHRAHGSRSKGHLRP